MDWDLKRKVDSLIVIRGVIKHMKRTKKIVNEFTSDEQSSAAGAAIGSALAGSAAGAVGGMQMVGYRGREMEFFSCELGNFSLHGYFNLVKFKAGEEVEAVVAPQKPGSSICEAVAIARVEDKVLWTRGHGVGYKLERRNRILFCSAFAGLIFLFYLVVALFQGELLKLDWWWYVAMLFVASIIGASMYFTQPASSKEIFALERRALELLGFENPDYVDISKEYVYKRRKDPSSNSEGVYSYAKAKILEHSAIDAHAVKPSDI